MPQVLKDSVLEAIGAAALQVFARKGYLSATMAEIAKAAHISTGNIYRYYPSKDDLFHAVVPEEFVRAFRTLLRRRVSSLQGVEDIRTLQRGAPFHLISEELLRYCIDNRLRVVVLLGRAEGSRYEKVPGQVVQNLIELAIEHFQTLRPELEPSEPLLFLLGEIYQNLLSVMVSTLMRFEHEPQIREAVGAYSRYHLTGLKSLFEG